MDSSVKYGLSVMGTVDPARIYANNTGKEGDALILTKKLGVGLVCCADRVGEASERAMQNRKSMTTLNKTASEILRKHRVDACTDVTGFGLLGHLHEMLGGRLSARIFADQIPFIPRRKTTPTHFFSLRRPRENRNHVGKEVAFDGGIPFAMEEILFDPWDLRRSPSQAVPKEDGMPSYWIFGQQGYCQSRSPSGKRRHRDHSGSGKERWVIYFDNAATSFPKPPETKEALLAALESLGEIPEGVLIWQPLRRTGPYTGCESSLPICSMRRTPLRIAFAQNTTRALNTAICGILNPEDHVITTMAEHNSVLRPLYRLEQQGVELTIVPVDTAGRIDMAAMERAVRKNTRAIVVTHASKRDRKCDRPERGLPDCTGTRPSSYCRCGADGGDSAD